VLRQKSQEGTARGDYNEGVRYRLPTLRELQIFCNLTHVIHVPCLLPYVVVVWKTKVDCTRCWLINLPLQTASGKIRECSTRGWKVSDKGEVMWCCMPKWLRSV